jgi:hypothetical protein
LFMIEHQLKLVETVINIFNTVKYIRCK